MREPKLPSVYKLIALNTVDSTNAEAKRLAVRGEDETADGTIVWAKEQTAGRGRRGRTWSSPKGNLYCSLILRPDAPASVAAQLSFVAGLAIHDALCLLSEPGHEVLVKWPNDILVNGKKVAGILLEAEQSSGDVPAWLILGLGLNVGVHPEDAEFPATSLRFEGWPSTEIDVLEAYCRYFLSWTSRWLDKGFEQVRKNWLWRCKGQGEHMEVRLAGETLTGVFADIDDNGALVLDQDGHQRIISAGDVYFGGS
ncbi:MAG: Bifunctional ligase/repressor BirA [Alphaproteobacteria bacterium MarineAlpha3_Bin4]|nr:biotin--[acetyl-CoA-carboxylase] ligase [Pseudomonadota bacterium]PPR75825.1 MAG: Bifunctional ligase/repressor BirA [Alphaproteobacteria bacterium MarineAlpha3_Bin4]